MLARDTRLHKHRFTPACQKLAALEKPDRTSPSIHSHALSHTYFLPSVCRAHNTSQNTPKSHQRARELSVCIIAIAAFIETRGTAREKTGARMNREKKKEKEKKRGSRGHRVERRTVYYVKMSRKPFGFQSSARDLTSKLYV